MLASVTTRLRHHVRLVHASTGRAVTGLTARLQPAPRGWGVRTLPDAVVVFARTDAAEPAQPPRLAVTVTGPQRDLLEFAPVPGRPPGTVLVDLTEAGIEVPLQPVPMTLTVVLGTAGTGAPRTGRTLTCRATSGPVPKPVVHLAEEEPGVYRSAAVPWPAAFTPMDLLVDGNPLRTLSMDLTRTATRIRLIDTN
ncbi:hypothetical protein Aca07nite_56640 [Actinoplanes capillaceus]|uniref:Uncharacterized protein n=1 Tax=Actinoplanes campanulatus TaxID=113559 RepID=A0ABQ3WQA9_9ACTN|nr:hypothetical protein [Actinoplanes capillaceus]GID48389.1 hypothetical protein Aca07nite_56640 [Actinoplanes capillaceus]